MKRRYIAVVHEMTAEEKDAWLKYIRDSGLGWWHWISVLWLIVDSRDKVNVDSLRDKLVEITGGKHNMVFEIQPGSTWRGFGPNSKEDNQKNMFRWLHDTWDKDS